MKNVLLISEVGFFGVIPAIFILLFLDRTQIIDFSFDASVFPPRIKISVKKALPKQPEDSSQEKAALKETQSEDKSSTTQQNAMPKSSKNADNGKRHNNRRNTRKRKSHKR